MSREVKYRVWDKALLKFWGADLYVDSEGTVYQMTGNEAEQWLEPTDNFIIVWFIGLKDKDGVEIYEGDIVRIWDYGFKDGNEDGDFDLYQDRGTDKVTMDRFPVYWLENEKFGYEGDDLISPEHCEVIGNIYENPELLETK